MGDDEPLVAAGVPPGQRAFDVVIANILRGPLLELQPRLTGWVGGWVHANGRVGREQGLGMWGVWGSLDLCRWHHIAHS